MAWEIYDACWFDRSTRGVVAEGKMPIDRAKELVMREPSRALGFTAEEAGEESEEDPYVYVVELGTSRYAGSAGTACHVFRPRPRGAFGGSEQGLFEDDFAGAGGGYADCEAWLRPGRGEGLGDQMQVSLFSSVDPNDIFQGNLGDCWLLSAFAALAEFPHHLMALFDTRTLTENGRYAVRLYSYERRAFVPYVIDDRLPASRGRCLAPADFYSCGPSGDGEIWPCLLEKAFAKYMGSYEACDGGWSFFAFGAMTGCADLLFCQSWEPPFEGGWEVCAVEFQSDDMQQSTWRQHSHQRHQDMLRFLADADAQNFLMCCDSGDGSNDDSRNGVVLGHCYSLLQVCLNVAGSGFDLLQLRNPWGDTEWTGDWSDESPLWEEHPEVAWALGHVRQDDGTFWMTWDDFCDNYEQMYICRKNMGFNVAKAGRLSQSRGLSQPRPTPRPKVSPQLKQKRRLHRRASGQSCRVG